MVIMNLYEYITFRKIVYNINVTKIDCSNEVNPSLPDSISNLTNLQELNLTSNKLTLPDLICNLTNLQAMFLRYNQLTSLPDSIGNLTN
jgi:Leucine-rich repeat (LRR) protein